MDADYVVDGEERVLNGCRKQVDVRGASSAEVRRSIKKRRTKGRQYFWRPSSTLLTQRKDIRPCTRIYLGKFGMKKLRLTNSVLPHYMIRPYTEKHMEPNDALFPITGCGDSKMVLDWFTQLNPSVKEKVKKAGFTELILCLQAAVIDGPLIQALATKWWDTTHTFHFTHFGELTMTPKDFSAITGLPVSGMPLFVRGEIHREKKLLHRLLGDAVCVLKKKIVPVKWLLETYTTMECMSEADEDVVARAFILALLGATIFATPSMTVDLHWLRLMSDISSIGMYNWGAAAFALLYNEMDDISRRNTFQMGGLWQSWEIWAREYLNIIPFILPTTCERVFPACKRWNLLHTPEEDPTIRLQYYNIKLENILLDNVNWNPWGNDATVPLYVVLSVDASRKRILLIRPNGSAWYLAERVLIQSFGIVDAYVPMDPPLSMLEPRTLSVRRSVLAFRGQCAHRFLNKVHNSGKDIELRLDMSEERNSIAQLGHICMDHRQIGAIICHRNEEVQSNAARLVQHSGIHMHDISQMELQTINFPAHMKQVPISTASKLLNVIGRLQNILMESVQNAEHKLRETTITVDALRDELGLLRQPGLDAKQKSVEEDSNIAS